MMMSSWKIKDIKPVNIGQIITLELDNFFLLPLKHYKERNPWTSEESYNLTTIYVESTGEAVPQHAG